MQISGTMQTPGERRGVSPPVTMPYQRAYAQPFQHEAICRSMKLRNGLHKLFCDLSAIELAETYRRRWTIETHFQFLTQSLPCEVAGLGKPRAALFMFAMALCGETNLRQESHAFFDRPHP